MIYRHFVIIAAVLAALGVALGAFGAHGLAAVFEANGRGDTFQTASDYHMYHALALLLVGLAGDRMAGRWATWAGYLLIAGLLLFSGSLYILAIFDVGFMGAVAPFGGTALIAGWLCIAAGFWRGTD